MLPFVYKVIKREENFLNSINSTFEYSFQESQFEIKSKVLEKNEFKFYKSAEEVGFTVFSFKKEFSVEVFDLDLDGSADGIFEVLTVPNDCVLLLKNHPKACFNLSAKVNLFYYLIKDESDMVCFDFLPYIEKLSKVLNPIHLIPENVQMYSDKFYETSSLTLKDFFNFHMNFEDHQDWPRAGPSDYRSFKYSYGPSIMQDVLNSKEFLSWLSSITGLPIIHPAVPIYTRCLQAAGDYQILHGNYSEPVGLDLISNFYPKIDYKIWSESSCGRIHYLNDSGDEIFQVEPFNNSLTIVYRTEGCTRFTENVKGTPEQALFQNIAIYTVASEKD